MKPENTISGKKITRKEALKGLGDPKTWKKHANEVYGKMGAKPELTDEQLNEEVAKLRGWKRTGFDYQDQDESFPRPGNDFYKLSNNGQWSGTTIPKFSTDMNLIRKAVTELDFPQQAQFLEHLKREVGFGIMSVDYRNELLLMLASPRHWCLAYIKLHSPKKP